MRQTTFDGFELPKTTPVPDIVFDELLGELTGNELKVLLYIIRRTYGFGKNADAISLSQFREGITTQDGKVLDKGCGIKHNRTILAALECLEKKKYVTATKRKTNAGDKDTTTYKLNFKKTCDTTPEACSSQEVVTPRNHVVTPGNYGSLPQVTTGSYPTSLRVVTPGNIQETVLQETVKQEDESDAHSVSPTPAISSIEEEDAAIAETVRQVTEAFPAPTLEPVVPRSYSRKQDTSLPGKGESKKRSAVTFASQASADLHTKWTETYGPYGDTQWDIAAFDWIAESHGTFEDIQLVYDFLKQKKPSESVRPEVVKNNWFRVNDLRKIKREREKAASQKRPTPAHVDDDDEPLQYRPPLSQRNKNNRPFQAIAAARRA